MTGCHDGMNKKTAPADKQPVEQKYFISIDLSGK
jgi:hypothetical protein